MIYPYLLQEKTTSSKRWSTVYGFYASRPLESYFDEYKGFWEKRKIRIIQNPKYKKSKLNIPEKLKTGY